MSEPRWIAILEELAGTLGHPRVLLIGAAALELQGHLDVQTSDRDLAVVLDEEDLLARMSAGDDWTRDARQPQRWLHRSGTLVDLIPSPPAAVRAGEHVWPDGARMSLIGFRHLLERGQRIPPLRDVEVASLPSIALLKMVAYLDRPAERVKDLRHLALLLDRYLPDDDERLWRGEAADRGYYNEDACAFLLGHDLHSHVDEAEAAVVRRFLDLVLDPNREYHRGRMATVATGSMQRDIVRVEQRLSRFEEGFKGSNTASHTERPGE